VARCHCATNFAPDYYFRLDLDRGELLTAGSAVSSSTAAERAWLRDTLLQHARLTRRPEWDAVLILGAPPAAADSNQRVIAYAARTDASGRPEFVYGLMIGAQSFGDSVFAPLGRDVIVTPSRTGSRSLAQDSLVTVALLDAAARPVFDITRRSEQPRMTMVPRAGHETYAAGPAPNQRVALYSDTVHLGQQFGGLILDVAVHSGASSAGANELATGSLPRSGLLVLFGLLVLMAGLVALAVLQLRREHELTRMRADFTTGVSHELRTPLAQILLYGETLILERTRSPREQRAAAEVIVREARRLMHLVENALHFARADRQMLRLAPEPVALASLTRQVLVSFAPLAWAARVRLRDSLDDSAYVLIDPAAFRQILLNLLDNGVKYGPADQTITVRLWRTGEMVRLAVGDEGPGIPPEERDRIWTPFVRLTNDSRKAPAGTGIGLAVVRDLTKRHGGRIWVEDAHAVDGAGRRRGALFVVELPATPSAAAAPDGAIATESVEGRPPAVPRAF
jgi:signal transduction histidine kinase